jgi:hypothetical protein
MAQKKMGETPTPEKKMPAKRRRNKPVNYNGFVPPKQSIYLLSVMPLGAWPIFSFPAARP